MPTPPGSPSPELPASPPRTAAAFYPNNPSGFVGSPWASPERPISSAANFLKEENERLTLELAQLRQSSQIEKDGLKRALEISQAQAASFMRENVQLKSLSEQLTASQRGAEEANVIVRSAVSQGRKQIKELEIQNDFLIKKLEFLQEGMNSRCRRHDDAVKYFTALVTSFAEFASEMSNRNYSEAQAILASVRTSIAPQQFVSTMGESCYHAIERKVAAMSAVLETAQRRSDARASASPVSFFQDSSFSSAEGGASSEVFPGKGGCGPNSPERRV